MAEIYESAYVTLAATKASDPTEGCFSTPAEQYRTRSMPLPTEANDDGSEENHTVHVRTLLIHDELGIPMFNRGWVRTTISIWN
jgi:hypothetical protein